MAHRQLNFLQHLLPLQPVAIGHPFNPTNWLSSNLTASICVMSTSSAAVPLNEVAPVSRYFWLARTMGANPTIEASFVGKYDKGSQ